MGVRNSFIHRFLLCTWTSSLAMTTACGPTTVSAQIQVQPTCVSVTPGVNPYQAVPQSTAIQLFLDYKTGSLTYDAVRQAALNRLGESMQRWSRFSDVSTLEGLTVRITLTYLDPILIEYIVLNQVLASSPQVDKNMFDSQLGETLRRLSVRNETLFILTFTSSVYVPTTNNQNSMAALVPVWQMELVNASGTRISPTHVDPILAQQIFVTRSPVSGMIGFPLSVMQQGQCAWVMDPWNSKLIVSLPEFQLGDSKQAGQFWDIPYRAMVMQDEALPVMTQDSGYDMNRCSKASAPPALSTPTDPFGWKLYWEDMGRYLWSQVVSEGLQ